MNNKKTREKVFPLRAVSGGILAMFLAFGVGRFAYTPLLPLMQEQAGLALDQAGYLASMMYLGYLAGSFGVTKTLARCGAMQTLAFGLLLLVAGTWLMAVGDAFPFWSVVMFVIGVSSAAIFLSALSLVLGVFLEYGAGWLTALLYTGIGAAIVLLGLAVPEIGANTGWRGAWRFASLAAAVGGGGCFFLLASGRRQNHKIRMSETEWDVPGAKRSAVWLIIGYVLHGFGYTIGGTFMVAMLAALPGFAGHAHLGWVLVGAMVIPSCVVWPLIASRFGEVRITAVLLSLLAVSNLIAVLWPSPTGILVAAGGFGSSFLAIPGLVLGRLGRLAGDKKDEVTGFATILFGIAMVLGPSIGGVLARISGNFDWALGMASAALFIASATTVMADRATKKHGTEPVRACPEGCR